MGVQVSQSSVLYTILILATSWNNPCSSHSIENTTPRLHYGSLLLKSCRGVHLVHVVLSVEIELCKKEVFETWVGQV